MALCKRVFLGITNYFLKISANKNPDCFILICIYSNCGHKKGQFPGSLNNLISTKTPFFLIKRKEELIDETVPYKIMFIV